MALKSNFLATLILVIVLFTAFLFTAFYGFYKDNSNNISGFVQLKNPALYMINYQVTANNSGFSPIKTLDVYVLLLKEQSDQQTKIINVSPDYESIAEDEYGNRIAKFHFENVELNQSVEVEICYLVKAYDKSFNLSAERNFKIYDNFSNIYKYTLPEKYIESDDSEIKKTAREIIGNESNLSAVKKIYDFVKENINYSKKSGSDRGALWTLKNKAVIALNLQIYLLRCAVQQESRPDLLKVLFL